MPAAPKKKARKASALTERQAAFVEAKLEGKTDFAAAEAAGYDGRNGSNVMKVAAVREEIAAARRWLTDTTQIKRLDVVEGILDSIEMGRMLGDPAAVRQGWVEIGKILGHYAPETKKIELSISSQRLRSKFEALSDEDLAAIAEGRTIDGEASRVQ